MIKAVVLGSVIAAGASTSALAQTMVTAQTRDDLAITIYNSDLAMVRDSRYVNLPQGTSSIAFEEVSARMMPQTAALTGGLKVIEQNFDFDLISPSALLNKAVGQEVLLYREDDDGDMEARDAVVLANNGGAAVLQVGSQIEVISNDFPGRIVFKKLPDNLRAKPTLSMRIEAEKAGDQRIELAYLTSGIRWSADYVGSLSRDETKMDITGLITLINNTGIAYTNAKTQLIAGDVNRVRLQRRDYESRGMVMAMSAKADMVEPEAVGDYHMYTLPQPTTIADKQTKQVTFMTAAKVPVEKVYTHRAWGFSTRKAPENVDVTLELTNDKASNLGIPLPKGIVRIYGQDSQGSAQFVGEDSIKHTAEGLDLDLTMGQAFDVTVTSRKVDDDLVSKTRSREIRDITMEYTLKNAKDSDVVVNLLQRVGPNAELLDSSLKAQEDDAQTLRFAAPISAKGERVVRFKVRVG
ncbi:MAG: DUF4139 domain-containing protein [Pseudomonadota bacterium]